VHTDAAGMQIDASWVMRFGWLTAGLSLFGSGVALAVALSGQGPTVLDKKGRRLALRARSKPLTEMAKALAAVAEPSVMVGATLLTSALAKSTGTRARLATAGALRIGLESGCKHVFARHRPPPTIQIGIKRGCSMPSGHALSVLPLLAIANELGSTRAQLAAVAFSLLLGASRVYLEKHNATDVAAGLLMGSGAACLLQATRSEPVGDAAGLLVQPAE
jgi:membrane-associated phospholipid phosphatase